MLAMGLTTTLLGMESHLVRVEVESSRGPGAFDLVGLAEASVRESHVRVRSALAHFGILLDEHRVVVNLAPGDVRKTGSAFDLAIASAILAALGVIPLDVLQNTVLLGELSLTGQLRPVQGLLPQLLYARSVGIMRAIVPRPNGPEAAVITGLTTWVADSLTEIARHFEKRHTLEKARFQEGSFLLPTDEDLADVQGQQGARRALEVAAAGHHHMLMIGPPGVGKTMLARRLPSILPPLTQDEALEVSAIHSVAGMLPTARGLLSARPFRAPHHTISDAGLVGGGFPPRPGELSLAHHGVLFLDELPEFRRTTLEALRQPLEDGVLVIARARARATFPAQPLFIATSNPCPCGYANDGSGRCVCSANHVRRYWARLSGPLLDRLDLHVFLPSVPMLSLNPDQPAEASKNVRTRVVYAHQAQQRRFQIGLVSARHNGTLSSRDIGVIAAPDTEGQRLLGAAVERLGLSARGYSKVLKVARTIADLAGDERVSAPHVAEAIQLRLLDHTRVAPQKCTR